MTRKDALAELIAKVEAGFDPEDRPSAFKAFRDPDHAAWALKAYNCSLDAAKALHDAVLLDWVVDQMGDRAGGWLVQLGRRDGKRVRRPPQAMVRGNPARAWLLAVLRALHSMEPDT